MYEAFRERCPELARHIRATDPSHEGFFQR